MKKRKILGIFAHPDDETFGPGGTLAKYAKMGHEIHVLTATHGQAGQAAGLSIPTTLGEIRKKELAKALKLLGVKSSTLLDFHDGSLNEQQIPVLQTFILDDVNRFKPDVIIVYERGGISLHLDHVAVSKAVTLLFDEKKIQPAKIYYFGLPVSMMKFFGREGGLTSENIIKIDVSDVLKIKQQAMQAHESQMKDWKRMFGLYEQAKKAGVDYGNHEYFLLARTTIKGLIFPENDLLNGL